MTDLKILSLNCNGFRSHFKQNLIKDFATKNKIDILLLQETYVDNLKLAKSIEQKFNLEKRCIWNFGKSNSCGVAIFLFNQNICIEKFHTDIFGRLIRLDFRYEGFSNFRLVNAYFPTNEVQVGKDQEKAQFRKLKDWILLNRFLSICVVQKTW